MSEQRRTFLKSAAAATVAAGLVTGCRQDKEQAGAQKTQVSTTPRKTIRWRMVTTWPPSLPIFADGVKMMADDIARLSDGRLQIDVYGGGELVPPLETFEAVRQGTVQMGHGASYYWAGKAAATQFFTAVPFGLNAQQMYAWLDAGGALKLWEELYADFGLIPIPAGNSGVQMGGWFNKKIESLSDLRGLKIRIPGLGGKVLADAGASPELLPGGELYTSLERGVIDATEWVGPYHDYIMGFHKVAKYYYYPGWHEPGSVLEVIVNKRAFEALPEDLQQIVRFAARRQDSWMLSQFEVQNSLYLKKLQEEEKTQILPFPEDVLKSLKEIALDTVSALAAQDPASGKIYQSFSKFQKDLARWGNLSERAFYDWIQIDV